eukprot:scaffold75385_cov81-Phaeocystis_antarctica.AAC.2
MGCSKLDEAVVDLQPSAQRAQLQLVRAAGCKLGRVYVYGGKENARSVETTKTITITCRRRLSRIGQRDNCASVSSTRARGRPNQTSLVRALARPPPARPPLVRRAQISPHHVYMQAHI